MPYLYRLFSAKEPIISGSFAEDVWALLKTRREECLWAIELHYTRWRRRIGCLKLLSCSAKEPLITGLFCGTWPMKIRHPIDSMAPFSFKCSIEQRTESMFLQHMPAHRHQTVSLGEHPATHCNTLQHTTSHCNTSASDCESNSESKHVRLEYSAPIMPFRTCAIRMYLSRHAIRTRLTRSAHNFEISHRRYAGVRKWIREWI